MDMKQIRNRKSRWTACLLAGVMVLLLLLGGCTPDSETSSDPVSKVNSEGVSAHVSAQMSEGTSSEASDEPEESSEEPVASEPVESSDEPEPSDEPSKPEESSGPEESSKPAESSKPEESSKSEETSQPQQTGGSHEGESEGTVYLTFDDGPSNNLTPQVLDILKEYGVHATFFVVGAKVEDKVDLIKRAIAEGHQIAMHGNSHEYEDIYKSVEAATENFFAENRKLQELLGIDVKIIRFPGGSSNQVSMKYCKGVMTNAARILLENGYNYFDWDVSSGDAGECTRDPDGIYKRVIEGVKPTKTNVVLMHDGNGHEATVEALPRILKTLLEKGYTFDIITDATPHVRHNIAN